MNLLCKIIYHFKIHLLRYISFFLVFLFSAVTLSFLFYPSVTDSANLNTYSSVNNVNEIWFGSSSVENDCFINLNGFYFANLSSKAISSDLLMQMESSNYECNIFNINYHLNADECILTKNIANEHRLGIGDEIACKDYRFRISDIIEPLSGIDDKYNHNGIIILGYRNEMIINKNASFIYFAFNGDGGINATKVISIETRKNNYKHSLLIKGLIISGVYLIAALVVELIVFHYKKSSYSIYRNMGIKPYKLFLNMLLDGVIKYVLPVALSLLLFIGLINSYLVSYLLCAGLIVLVMSLIAIITSLLYFIRRSKYE